jgi:tRNA-Thr(GGU) m(6)t(6)A37 methyltransferase TsaA
MTLKLHPIGWIRKSKKTTTIVIYKKYQPGLMGIDKLSGICVVWWFNRNDNPRMRSILKVHPKGNPANPLRGVFATRAPMRPNLIALSYCKVLSVKNNVIEIEEIDALPDTPVLDLKPERKFNSRHCPCRGKLHAHPRRFRKFMTAS